MSSRKKDYRQELGRFDIHMKTGKEQFLQELGTWWHKMYPAKADFFRTCLKRMKEVTVEHGRVDLGKGREMYLRYRVPTELMMFIQRWIPDFGRDDKDLDLLARVWCDLIHPTKDYRRRTRLYVTGDIRRVAQNKGKKKGSKKSQSRTDSEEGADHRTRQDNSDRPFNSDRAVFNPGLSNDHRQECRDDASGDDQEPESELFARLRRAFSSRHRKHGQDS